MRTLLLLLCVIPYNVCAQRLSIGAGISANTMPRQVSAYYDGDWSRAVSPAFTLSYLHPIGKGFLAGAEISAIRLANKHEEIGRFTNGYPHEFPVLTYTLANPALGISALIAKDFVFGRNRMTTGASGGFLKAFNDEEKGILHSRKGDGYSIGLTGAYSRTISKHVSIGVQVAPRYASFKMHVSFSSMEKVPVALFYCPTLLTVSYAL